MAARGGEALGPGDLVLCSGSLPRATFRERAAAAAAGGFRGLSLWARQVERAAAVEGLSPDDMQAVLADAGVLVGEVEALIDVLGNPETPVRPSAREVACHRIADAFGARSLTVVEGEGAPLDLGAAGAAFGAVCDRAAEYGLLVHLEFWPGSRADLTTAAAVVDRAARPNGGLLVDAWHVQRTPGALAALRAIDRTPVLGVQLSDGPREPAGPYLDETMHRRRVPGEGDFDLVGLLHLLWARGVAAPLGVEVLSDALGAVPPAEVARRLGDATRALVARARREVR
jgi:sugar phosphate isomerase/epimerase